MRDFEYLAPTSVANAQDQLARFGSSWTWSIGRARELQRKRASRSSWTAAPRSRSGEFPGGDCPRHDNARRRPKGRRRACCLGLFVIGARERRHRCFRSRTIQILSGQLQSAPYPTDLVWYLTLGSYPDHPFYVDGGSSALPSRRPNIAQGNHRPAAHLGTIRALPS